jgi:hypothetical protein
MPDRPLPTDSREARARDNYGEAITRLTKLGVIAPAPHGRYHLQASVYSYCAFLRAMTARGGEGAEEILSSKSSKDQERH